MLNTTKVLSLFNKIFDKLNEDEQNEIKEIVSEYKNAIESDDFKLLQQFVHNNVHNK